MSPAILFLSIPRCSIKKLMALLAILLFALLLMPIAVMLSIGTPTLDWLAKKPDAKTAETHGFYSGPIMPDNTYAWGNCTWWAYAMRKWAGSPIPNNWGNANTWDDNSRRQGYIVNHTPAIGAIYQADAGDYGHVAYVIAVNNLTGEWTISEMNAPTLNVVSQRTFSKAAAKSYTFIHNKIGEQPWTPNPITSLPPYNTGLRL